MSKAAALLAWAPGLGFGLPCIYGIWYLADRGHVWTFMGFPTYGGGPFEGIGVETTVPLLAAFLPVCVAEMVAGWLLWRNQRAGGLLALALLPVDFAFWIRFALPLGPVGSGPDRLGPHGLARISRPPSTSSSGDGGPWRSRFNDDAFVAPLAVFFIVTLVAA
jgi:hypothetical protein